MREKELIDWVERFMTKNSLFAPHGVVGLSGGADSILLSHVLEALRERGHFKYLRHIHIDHGLRPESGEQAFNLQKYAQQRGWEFELIKVTGPTASSNIESWARDQRKSIFKESLSDDEILYLGHHVDDSFEWFIRQTVGSSASGHTHGIPLINGNIRRPFHCLTKDQILKFTKSIGLPVQNDESNESMLYQRNAISKMVKKPLLQLFPKGLAHFVEHANSWAKKEGLSAHSSGRACNDIVLQNYIGAGVYSLIKVTDDQKCLNDWEAQRDEIVSLITMLSDKKRGELRQNLDKLISAASGNGARGPLSFSGGVKVYIYPGMLLFVNGMSASTLKTKNSLIQEVSQIPFSVISMNEAFKKIEQLGGCALIAFSQESLFDLEGLKSDQLFGKALKDLHGRKLNLRPFSHLYQRAAKKGLLDKEFNGLVIH